MISINILKSKIVSQIGCIFNQNFVKKKYFQKMSDFEITSANTIMH